MNLNNKVTVLVVDDHPIFRHGLVDIISKSTDLLVVGQAESGEQALDAVEKLEPDVTVLDIDMPGMDGIMVATALRARGHSTKVIFLTMYKDRSVLRSLNQLGVWAYVLKDSASNEIVDCIGRVMRGKTYLSQSISELMIRTDLETKRVDIIGLHRLTLTERAVLYCIAESRTNREIADAMFISVRTVETHRYNICSKLGLSGPSALLRFALSNSQTIFTNCKAADVPIHRSP
jgi:DNA-binding NarL/FixJ family response regulator